MAQKSHNPISVAAVASLHAMAASLLILLTPIHHPAILFSNFVLALKRNVNLATAKAIIHFKCLRRCGEGNTGDGCRRGGDEKFTAGTAIIREASRPLQSALNPSRRTIFCMPSMVELK
jgi:hypothetical protein